jgi:hypothetical protein
MVLVEMLSEPARVAPVMLIEAGVRGLPVLKLTVPALRFSGELMVTWAAESALKLAMPPLTVMVPVGVKT